MTFLERSEPLFFVRVKPPPKTRTPGPVPKTKRVADATEALKVARAAMVALLAASDGGPAVLVSSDLSDEARAYLAARKNLRLAEETYARVVAEARANVKAPPEPATPTPDLTAHVMSFEYEEDEKKADQLTLTLRNDDLAYFDSPLFEKGTTLHVGWGYAGALAPTREVVVQKVTGARTLKVIAQSKSVLMNKLARVRTFEHKTRAEVARQIAEENGYSGARLDIDPSDARHAVLSQAAQTDAQFLKRLADQEGFEFYVDFDGFHWHARRLAQRPVRVLTYYLPPGVGDILDFNIENDVTAKPGTVIVKGRDPLTKKTVAVTADNASVKRPTLAPIVGIPDVKTGEKVWQRKAVAAAETRPTSETTPAAVKAEAAAVYRRTQQTAVELTLDLVGDPYLVAKTVVEVRGLGKRLSGKYYLASLKHTLDSGGYKLSAKAKTDGTQTGAAKALGTPKATPAAPPATPTAAAPTPGALTIVQVKDAKTGQTTFAYVDTRARERAAASGEK